MILTWLYLCCFNPHTHEGCDIITQKGPETITGFNPHTHEGCDIPADLSLEQHTGFNPHTHEGCDQDKLPGGRSYGCFNPHTHEGCDERGGMYNGVGVVSIHTPTKGVTDELKRIAKEYVVSIHTPTKGVTQLDILYLGINEFQSTHPRRV